MADQLGNQGQEKEEEVSPGRVIEENIPPDQGQQDQKDRGHSVDQGDISGEVHFLPHAPPHQKISSSHDRTQQGEGVSVKALKTPIPVAPANDYTPDDGHKDGEKE